MSNRRIRVTTGTLFLGLVVLASVSLTRAQSKPPAENPSATIEGTVIKLKPSGATVEIPRRWLDWHAIFKNNLHLTRPELEKVKTAEGDWDKEYAEVVNAVLPLSTCAAHVGGEGWGREAVSYGDLQVRAYILADLSPEQVQEKVATAGVARASKLSERASAVRSEHGKWRRATVNYEVWYGD